MSRKSLRDLTRRQFLARLNPLLNEYNDENIDEVDNEQNVEGMNNDIGDQGANIADILIDNEPINNLNIAEIHDNFIEEQHLPPASPPRADNLVINEEEVQPEIEDIYNMLLQNNAEDHVLVADEVHLNDLPPEIQENYFLNDDNIFENPVFEDPDISDDEDIRVENGRDEGNDDTPLYFGAEITLRESMLSILSVSLRHNLTATCVNDVIALVEMHCLRRNLIKNSLYKFRKYFSLGEASSKKHFYCPSCAEVLNAEDDVCRTCPRVKSNYFLEMPVIQHLTEMYQRENFYNSLQKRFDRPVEPNIISDVYDGQLYRDWYNNGFLANPHNISFTWYTDGIPVFKSSKVGTYVIYLTINELPPEERKKIHNTLLLGLWFGDKKPHFNTFMYAFRLVFEKFIHGIRVALSDWQLITVRAVLLMGVCDLPAKCDSLNFVQFNGTYGCPVCFFPGEVIEIGQRSHLQVYPFTENFELRTVRRCEELALQAIPGHPQFGVKGFTALSKIMPDFLRGMCIDRMHCVDGGVVKKILTLLFDSSHSNKPFSLHRSTDIINSRLIMIKPPKFCHRMPRTTNDLIHWKASELKFFFYYYSLSVFEGLMRQEYYEHYSRLLFAMFLLSADKVDRNLIDVAEDLIYRFVREFQELYDVRFSSINVHLLLHLPNCVRENGPLWVYTCYEYEDMNGRMLNLIHGTRYIGSQVANGHQYVLRMVKETEHIVNEDVLNFCTNKKKQSKLTAKICNNGYSVGKSQLIEDHPQMIIDAFNNKRIILDGARMWQFARLLKNDKLYVSKSYRRAIKTSTSVATYYDNESIKIGSILCFIKYINCQCMQHRCNCEMQYFAIIRELISNGVHVADGDRFRYDSSNFYHKCYESHIVNAIPITDIITPCIFIKLNHGSYVVYPINTKELE